MSVFLLILIAVVGLLVFLILYGDTPRRTSPPSVVIPSSISYLTEPGRPPLPHEWKYKYVPIAKTTLATRDGKTWVRYREDVPLLSSHSSSTSRELRQHRIIFN